jgi:hypothetical protein
MFSSEFFSPKRCLESCFFKFLSEPKQRQNEAIAARGKEQQIPTGRNQQKLIYHALLAE